MEPHSTLEPINPQHDAAYQPNTFPEGLEATPIENHHTQSHIEALAPYEGQYLQPSDANNLAPTYVKPEDSPSTSPRSASSVRQYVDQTAIVRAPPAKRICGLRRRYFWFTASIIAIVLIGAIVGGVVGGLASKKSSKSASRSKSSSGDGPKLHDLSKLAASNWTDTEGVERKIVFMQGEDHNIFARSWDSDSKKWATSNISSIMSEGDEGPPPATFPGAAFSAAGTFDGTGKEDQNDHQVWLWYQTVDHEMHAIGNDNTTAGLKKWTEWVMKSDPKIKMDTRSRIGATYRRCADGEKDCDGGTWHVVYQDNDGNVQVVNSTDWGGSWVLWEADDVARPTPLAIMPFFLEQPDQYNIVVQRASNEWVRSTYYNDGRWKQNADNLQTGLESSTSTFASQFAGTRWDDMTQQLYVATQSNGEVILWWKNDKTKKHDVVDNCEFVGWDKNPEPKWRSIATDMASTFYGVSEEGWVLEYSIGDGTGHFDYKSTVYQPNDDL